MPAKTRINSFFLALVTVPDQKTGLALAKAALEARLVACANIIPGVQSFFWWQGKIDRARELLVLFKTTRTHLAALEKLVRSQHPYETPEFIALRLDSGSRKYLQWIADSVK